jgi:hypothetical protein
MSAYVSRRQHTSPLLDSAEQPAEPPIRQHTSAYVVIRQHTSPVFDSAKQSAESPEDSRTAQLPGAAAAPPQASVLVLLY